MTPPKKTAIEPLTETQYLRNLLAQLRRELEASKAENAELRADIAELKAEIEKITILHFGD